MATGCSKTKPLQKKRKVAICSISQTSPQYHLTAYESALLSPNLQQISTSVLLINADFCTHQGSTCTTATLILGSHVQPVSQKQGNRGEI